MGGQTDETSPSAAKPQMFEAQHPIWNQGGKHSEGNLDEGEGRGRGLCSHRGLPLHWDLFLCTSIALTKRHSLSREGQGC